MYLITKCLFIATLLLVSLNVKAQSSGNSLHFDGVDDYVSMTLPSAFIPLGNNDFSAECWIKVESLSFSRILFAQLNASNLMSISLNPTGEVVFYLEVNGVNHSVQSTEVINVDEWTHVAVTWDAANASSEIIVNGLETSLASGSFVSSTGIDGTMSIGAKTDGTQNFNGEIDDLRIWSVEKEICEFQINATSEVQGSESDLIVAYGLNNGNGGMNNTSETTVVDAGPSSEDGTLHNFTLHGGTSNFLTSGVTIDHYYDDPFLVSFDANDMLVVNYEIGMIQWNDCDLNAPIVGENSGTFSPFDYSPTGGSFSVTVTNGNCVNTSECFDAQTFGLDPKFSNKIEITPNPVKDQLRIEGAGQIDFLIIKDTEGRIVAKFEASINDEYLLNVSTWKSGVYFVSGQDEIGTFTQRFVKI